MNFKIFVKFLHLKKELDKYEKKTNLINKEEKEERIIPPIFKQDKVIGGGISRDPINKQAALLVAKAPWYFKPPYEEKKMKETKEKVIVNQATGKISVESGKELSADETHVATATGFNKMTINNINDVGELVRKTVDAREAMEELTSRWRSSWVDFSKESGSRLRDLQMTRMATESEMNKLLSQLRDVRCFLLDPKHEQEIARLKEFVEICERLKQLKDSGFLDTVADTMLKLS